MKSRSVGKEDHSRSMKIGDSPAGPGMDGGWGHGGADPRGAAIPGKVLGARFPFISPSSWRLRFGLAALLIGAP
jgi:hypothetical protein